MPDLISIPIDGFFKDFQPNKNYIILFNSNKIPPHLGFVTDKKYFSLTYHDCQIEESITPITRYFSKGKNECLVVELKSFVSIIKTIEVFNSYHVLNDGKTTCLFPIKELCGLKNDEIQFVYQLIPELLRKKEVSRISGVNLPTDTKEIHIFPYTMEDIQDRIKNLANVGGK